MLPKVDLKACVSEESQKSLIRGAATILEPFGIGVSLLSDKLACYRFECLIGIVNKAKILCKENGINPKPVSKKFLARFAEEASYEDDPDLQDMWANLLAGESFEHSPLNQSYISILRNLNAETASILQDLYCLARSHGFDVLEETIRINTIGSFYGSPSIKEYARLIDDSKINQFNQLKYYGTIEIEARLKGDESFVHGVITPLGYEFISACKSIKTNDDEVENDHK